MNIQKLTEYLRIFDLKIEDNFTLEEIKNIYRVKAKYYHPDAGKVNDNGAMFMKIKEAYDFIVDNFEDIAVAKLQGFKEYNDELKRRRELRIRRVNLQKKIISAIATIGIVALLILGMNSFRKTVTFDPMLSEVSNIKKITKFNGMKVYSPEFIREGYTLVNWYETSNHQGEPIKFPYNVKKDTTLYAKWSINKYKVSFDSNGGTGIDTIEVEYGTIIPMPVNPKFPGHGFIGWFVDRELKDKFDFETQKMPARDLKLYAKWLPPGPNQ